MGDRRTVLATSAAAGIAIAGSSIINASAARAATSFVDVPGDYVFATEIQWMADKGISTGWVVGSTKEFRPNDSILRDAVAAFFYRYAQVANFTAPARSPFIDVPTGRVFYKEICWLADAGISKGWPDGTFKPDSPVLRDAVAAFFYRLAGSPAFTAPATSPFKDVSQDKPFYKEICWLADSGITRGWPDGTFHPYEEIKRDAMAAFLYRFDQKFGYSPTDAAVLYPEHIGHNNIAEGDLSVGWNAPITTAAGKTFTDWISFSNVYPTATSSAVIDVPGPGRTFKTTVGAGQGMRAGTAVQVTFTAGGQGKGTFTVKAATNQEVSFAVPDGATDVRVTARASAVDPGQSQTVAVIFGDARFVK
ncbi:S-layer homology domain-containing protein [Rothia sp. LK2588]|uniref:S-layer homology domain-containing protein n=1 Tax=Rothia sp. LK2588 TaxID=3114369 RepID=UPI0034CD27E6